MPIQVRLVGPLAVARDGGVRSGAALGSRKARTLLALIATERGRPVSVERIAETLWSDEPPVRAAENIASLVSRLRRVHGAPLVVGGRDGYRLGPAPAVVVDLDEAATWIGEAERRLAAGEPALALATGGRADELLSAGEVLADEPWAEWAAAARSEAAAFHARLRHALSAAALAVGDLHRARTAAAAALGADPFDELAVRDAMRAHAAAGEPARALAAFAELRDRLTDELGADPAAETQELHLAILRADRLPAGRPPRRTAADSVGIVGRAEELQRLRTAWNAAAGGRGGLVAVVGEAGIGKSRLCAELREVAMSTGGRVLSVRCFETERSLFLQPLVEGVAELARRLAPVDFTALAGEHAMTLAGLVPEAAAVLGPAPDRRPGRADLERRRAFEAVGALLRVLSRREAVLLVLDDLHNAGRSTLEFLHFLMRGLTGEKLLVLAGVRAEEGEQALNALAEVSTQVEIGPLPERAVAELAGAMGLGGRTDEVMRRTGGHALYVVEALRALAAGDEGLPASLEAAVSARVRRAGRPVEDMLRAAAVLGSTFDPVVLSALVGGPRQAVATGCADAVAARLLIPAGPDYEFAHDLVREVLYATTPEPTRRAYHRATADLFTDRPATLAAHSAAAGDWERAAHAYLLAGEQALARGAAGEAVELLGRSLSASSTAGGLSDVLPRALLARGRAFAAQTDYRATLADIEAARTAARTAGDRRMEILALRALGGEVAIALGQPAEAQFASLSRALALATSMADRALAADVEGWMAVVSANGLRFAESVEYGTNAVRAARASGDEEALIAALDGRKTALAYLGEVAELEPVLEELEPLLRRRGDLFRLHWAVFESSFPFLARADWAGAGERMGAALKVQRRSGFSAYAAWHVAHLGWLAHLRGDLADAMDLGRRSLALVEEAPHLWCAAAAGGLFGATLLAMGDREGAVGVLERAWVSAEQAGTAAYRLRVLAPLAEATGSPELLAEADALVTGITAPSGSAWLVGDWCYLAVARAWLARGEPARARQVLAPLLAAAERVPWVAVLARAAAVDRDAAAALGSNVG